MGISIKNVEPLGSEIIGLDLSKSLSPENRAAIEQALETKLVVVARDQLLSDPELIAFSLNFGELDPPGPNPYGEPFNKDFPDINVISNVIENGRPIGGLGAGEAALVEAVEGLALQRGWQLAVVEAAGVGVEHPR